MNKEDVLLTPEEIKATSPTAPWYVGCEQCAQRVDQAQLKKVVEWGDEPCPHFPTIKMGKHACPQCWQSLREIANEQSFISLPKLRKETIYKRCPHG